MYTDDLASLEVLTEDAIVEQLQKRYIENQIYTYIGDILVAVNPFTDIGIYTSKVNLWPRISVAYCVMDYIYYNCYKMWIVPGSTDIPRPVPIR